MLKLFRLEVGIFGKLLSARFFGKLFVVYEILNLDLVTTHLKRMVLDQKNYVP